jgi:hypothetical protein
VGVSARTRLLAGAAGLGYVVLASVENMEVLDAPLLGSGDAAFRDHALGVVTTVAGGISLALYLVFAVLLRRRWAAAAVAGVALALVGVVASVLLLSGGSPSLFDLGLRGRFLAGPFMALYLVGAAAVVPDVLRRAAWVVAVPLALTPLANLGGHGLQVASGIAFGAHALWIWLVALWLLCGHVVRAEFVRRAAFLMLVVAAGAVGLALLAVPDATGAFFAWTLKPAPLAAFAGGIYVASAVVYAAGIRAGWDASRPLVLAAVVLSLSVFVVTLVHLEVFDLHRLQAWAWLALFAGFGLVTSALALRRRPSAPGSSLPAGTRSIFAATGTALAAAGLALWADPAAFDLPPLGGRFAGSWTVMLAVLALWPAVRGRAEEARLPALALVALPIGALAAAARTGVDEPAYLAALTAVLGAGLVLRLSTRPDRVDITDVVALARMDTRGHLPL